jgi:hypothetical protein
MSAPAPAARPKRGPLLLLLLLFFTPLLLSFVIYYGSDWRPAGHTNHGVLIAPARTLPPIGLPQVGLPQGATPSLGDATASVMRGKWSLVYIGRGECDVAQFPAERRASSIFVVDPRGNLMMRYDAHEDPGGLRNDLKKLLALSHIG